ncbi:gastric triacylglycerol lipase-like protein [Leptotrombidium deliense]|uniref:Gastric triacylglycerol lipase-like protein n=1 Tax=Leptotrombidium deliense TaxID=299467 RepID=A0A443SI13_9ACAR|nr:gastric triacylglycerol lipase-like protein [Leptotrombidium deliense]
MFGLLSEKPEYSQIIQPFIALAPVTRLANVKTLMRFPISNRAFMSYLYETGGSFWPANSMLNSIGKNICSKPILAEICALSMFLFSGFDAPQLNKTRMSVYVSHTPAGSSAWNVLHYGQSLRSKLFRKFDFGEEENVRRYGSRTPPVYDLLNISKTSKKFIALLHSRNDYLADTNDVRFIYDKLKDNLILDFQVAFEKWNHLDFIWGLQSAKYVNVIVIQLLEKYRNYP